MNVILSLLMIFQSYADVSMGVGSDSIAKAKLLLSQGQRKKAIEELERVQALSTASKRRQKEVSDRRNLFAEQFLTSDSFQKFQEARAHADLQRWDECLRELSNVGVGDQDNALILRLRLKSQFNLKQYEQAEKTAITLLELIPTDVEAQFAQVRIMYEQSKYIDALIKLQKIQSQALTASNDLERLSILKARIFEAQKKPDEAIEVLKLDQETNLDHVEVLYELGMLYRRVPGHDWPARKALSLFVTRCKRMKEEELKRRSLDELLPRAQAALAELDKQLGV
jgi:tetratricopeptide (TPR) repeat protein